MGHESLRRGLSSFPSHSHNEGTVGTVVKDVMIILKNISRTSQNPEILSSEGRGNKCFLVDRTSQLGRDEAPVPHVEIGDAIDTDN